MELELQIDGGKYPIEVKLIVGQEGSVSYFSEYKGSTISTFPQHQKYKGESLEQSVSLIAKSLRKALQELLAQ